MYVIYCMNICIFMLNYYYYYYSVAFHFILLPICTLCCVCNWRCSCWLGTLIIKNWIEIFKVTAIATQHPHLHSHQPGVPQYIKTLDSTASELHQLEFQRLVISWHIFLYKCSQSDQIIHTTCKSIFLFVVPFHTHCVYHDSKLVINSNISSQHNEWTHRPHKHMNLHWKLIANCHEELYLSMAEAWEYNLSLNSFWLKTGSWLISKNLQSDSCHRKHSFFTLI
jgi:hypothetical protein